VVDPASADGDAVLGQLGATATLTSIGEVIQVLQKLDNVLPDTDGLKWFNLLYLDVTRAVYQPPPVAGWDDEPWLTRLDIIFAQLYFDALSQSYSFPGSVPSAWQALFEARHAQDVQRVQFALAGMNAHINHDLPLAVVQTCEYLNITPGRGTPEYHDYETVNGIIDGVEPKTLQFLANEIPGQVAQDLNVVGRVIANWNVIIARDSAWTNAELLWQLRDLPLARDGMMRLIDRLTGFAGRGLLISV
jgi:hypothetical protein